MQETGASQTNQSYDDEDDSEGDEEEEAEYEYYEEDEDEAARKMDGNSENITYADDESMTPSGTPLGDNMSQNTSMD